MISTVPDVRLVQNTQFPRYSVTIDWNLLGDGTLDDTQALATAIIVALGTNALADATDEMPDPDSTDRAGWWGNLDADVIWNGWDIGAKLWLLRRSAIEFGRLAPGLDGREDTGLRQSGAAAVC